MVTLHDEPGKAVLEHHPAEGIFVIHWYSYLGPHYRRTIEALLAAVKKFGGRVYISDAARPTDVASQEDLKWISTVAAQMPQYGVKHTIIVQPKSNIAKMGAKRLGTTLDGSGINRQDVASLEEAFAIARKLSKAA